MKVQVKEWQALSWIERMKRLYEAADKNLERWAQIKKKRPFTNGHQ